MVSKGDTLRVEGEEFTVARVDDYNRRIHFEDGGSFHKAALCSGEIEVV